MLGWNVVVKKGEFQVGDLVVYFEIDSLLPNDNPEFDFLKNSKGKMKALKTKRLMGVYSQGLVMPVTILPNEVNIIEELDVTEVLKVVKYEPPEIDVPFYKGLAKVKLATYPNFLRKTDEERVQTLQRHLDYCKDKEFVVTEKLDGTSYTVFVKNGKVGCCSRNMLIDTSQESLYADVFKQYELETKLLELREQIGFDFALQGEIIGKGIQKNRYKLTGYEVRWFNFFNIETQSDIGFYFTDTEEQQAFNGFNLGMVSALLGMETVPILDTTFPMSNDIDSLVNYSIGKSVLNPETEREGVVFRAKYNRELSLYGERVSFKAINPVFLCS